MEKLKILVVDDESRMRKLVRDFLVKQNFEVVEAEDGEDALNKFYEQKDIALIILDVMMPKINGWEVCKEIRENSRVPVIMLTARDAVMDKVSGLDSGADDYITKPFAIEELLARIRVVFKKRSGQKQTRKFTVKGVTMDTDRHEVTYNGEIVELNHREYELVRILMENKNIVLNREKLLDSVCGYDYMGETNIIDVYVRHIRSKLDDRFGIKFITTVRGVGYAVKED